MISSNPVILAHGTTALSPELINAYLDTQYKTSPQTNTPNSPDLVLEVGVQNHALLALLTEHQATSAAFITAWNPLGQALGEEDNQRRQDHLAALLTQRHLRHWHGIGQGKSGQDGKDCLWPGEESFLILGLDLHSAIALGQEVKQNAIVWAGEDGVPRLVVLR